MGSPVERFEAIRRDRRTQALSIREIDERLNVHRRVVRQGLASALSTPIETTPHPLDAKRVPQRTDRQIPLKARSLSVVKSFGPSVSRSNQSRRGRARTGLRPL